MNQKIANIIKGHISSLDFVDKIAGLVTTATLNIGEGDAKVQKSFPVACCVTADDCCSRCITFCSCLVHRSKI